MNTLKKTLMAATMVVALGSTTSCGNKENSQEFVAGTPYTLVGIHLRTSADCTIEFGCEGNPTTYWDYAKNPEQSDHKKSHTYVAGSTTSHPVILIEGNISSLWFCDESGVPLQNDNARIGLVVFSNTITSIREYACYGLKLEGAYIPASVKTMGKYAFMPYEPETFFCEPPARPSGWDAYWCTIGEYNRFVTWGFSYHITESGEVYVLIADGDVRTAFYQGNIFPTASEALVIPKPLNVNNRDFVVVSIESVGNAKHYITSVTIPDTVLSIGDSAFSGCTKLKQVNFGGDFVYLEMGNDVFWNCTTLETITLPEGLVNVPNYAFEDCYELKYVKIPSSVKTVGQYVFWSSAKEKDLIIDLTAFKDPNKIAYCNSNFLSYCDANKVTFKIDSSLKEKNFTDNGWPATAESPAKPEIEWVHPTSLA